MSDIWVNPYKGSPYHYKGQTHCHSEKAAWYEAAADAVVGGAHLTPGLVAGSYADKGYSFVCLTDHNRITRLSEALKRRIIFINGVEDGQSYGHHILALGMHPENIKQTDHTKYFDAENNGVCDWQTYDCSNVPGRVYFYSGIQHAITVMGHPREEHGGSRYATPGTNQGFTLNELRANAQATYRGIPYSYDGIELYNSSNSDRLDDVWCCDWWDQLLESGKRVWGFAGDDCHHYPGPDHSTTNRKSFNRSWIVVNSSKGPAEVSEADIIRSIRAGDFYTVVRSPDVAGETIGDGGTYSGPSFDIRAAGNQITVTADPLTNPVLTVVSRPGVRVTHQLRPVSGGKMSATFQPAVTDKFVRVILETRYSGELYRVFSQPLFRQPGGTGVTVTVPTRPGTTAPKSGALDQKSTTTKVSGNGSAK